MAFVCPPRVELLKQRRILNGIKSVLEDLQRDMTPKIQLQEPSSCCPPCCQPPVPARTCPVQSEKTKCDEPKQAASAGRCPAENGKDSGRDKNGTIEPPDVMVCYKVGKNGNKKKKRKEDVIRLKQSKSRELRASILHVGCLCEKRNGLQDNCARSECHGGPECLTQPSPTCGPSEFCDGKHLYKKLRKNQKMRQGIRDEDSDAEDQYEYQCFPGTIETNGKKDDYCDRTNCPVYN